LSLVEASAGNTLPAMLAADIDWQAIGAAAVLCALGAAAVAIGMLLL
jgi:hypothetical protein